MFKRFEQLLQSQPLYIIPFNQINLLRVISIHRNTNREAKEEEQQQPKKCMENGTKNGSVYLNELKIQIKYNVGTILSSIASRRRTTKAK